jgi:hypothetical protein
MLLKLHACAITPKRTKIIEETYRRPQSARREAIVKLGVRP